MPVHGLIKARGDNIVSSRHGMAAEKREEDQNHKAIPEGE